MIGDKLEDAIKVANIHSSNVTTAVGKLKAAMRLPVSDEAYARCFSVHVKLSHRRIVCCTVHRGFG